MKKYLFAFIAIFAASAIHPAMAKKPKITTDKILKDGRHTRVIFTSSEKWNMEGREILTPYISIGYISSEMYGSSYYIHLFIEGDAATAGINTGNILLFKTKDGEVIQLRAGADSSSESEYVMGDFIGDTYFMGREKNYVSSMYRISESQLNKLTSGVRKMRIQLADYKKFECEYASDARIGKKLKEQKDLIDFQIGAPNIDPTANF